MTAYQEDFFLQVHPATAPAFWIGGDVVIPPGSAAQKLILPPEFPLVAKFHSIQMRSESIGGQFMAAIDKRGISFKTGIPPWHQSHSDFHHNQRLLSVPEGTLEARRDCTLPYLLDQTKGDLLWVQLDGSVAGIKTLILGVERVDGYAFAPSGWFPSMYWRPAANGNGTVPNFFDNPGWQGYTLASVITPEALEIATGWSDLKARFAAGLSAGFQIGKVTVGPLSGTGMTQMFSGGNPGATVGAGGAADFQLGGVIDATAGVVVKAYFSGSSTLRSYQEQPGCLALFKSGDDTASPSITGYSECKLGTGPYDVVHSVGLQKLEMLF